MGHTGTGARGSSNDPQVEESKTDEAKKVESPVIEIKYEIPAYQTEMWSVQKDTIYAAVAAIQLALGYIPQIKTEVPQWQKTLELDVKRMQIALEELQKLKQHYGSSND
jgi:hypothetical protein